MKFRLVAFGIVAAVGLGLGSVAAQQQPTTPAGATTTPPPPPLPNTNRTAGPVIAPTAGASTATPPSTLPSPSPAQAQPAPRRGKGQGSPAPSPGASASETPEPPQFTTLDGVWELEVQPLGKRVVYQHLRIIQKGSELSGTWMRGRDNGGDVPYTGTFDGRLFQLNLKDAAGSTWTMAGYSDNLDNLVGLLKTADPKDQGTPFTAQHRRKESVRGAAVPPPGGAPGGIPR